MNVAQYLSIYVLLLLMTMMIAQLSNRTDDQWMATMIAVAMSFLFMVIGVAMKIAKNK